MVGLRTSPYLNFFSVLNLILTFQNALPRAGPAAKKLKIKLECGVCTFFLFIVFI